MSPLKRLVSAAAVASLGVAAAAAPALAAGTAGQATQTPAVGGNATAWQLKLPNGAACSGDSIGAGGAPKYQVFSYVVSTRYAVSSLTFGSDGPVAPDGTTAGSGVSPLYDTTGSPYTSINTNTGTGAVPSLPQFTYAQFDTTYLPAGSYNVGIACARAQTTGPSVLDSYWNAGEVTMATTGGAFTYAFVPPAPAATVPETPFAAALPIAAIALLGAGAFITVRRRSSTPTA